MISIVESHQPVRVTAGAGAAVAAVTRLPLGDRPLLLRDAAVESIAAGPAAEAIEIVVESGAANSEMLREVLLRGAGATSVIALGGGSVIDLAKLARLLLDTPRLSRPLDILLARSGFVRIPELAADAGRGLPLLAIPTTFGTGAEASQVACLVTSKGRRLLSGTRLRPDYAALDPSLTQTLPAVLQREGLFEVILRVIGPAIGSAGALAADGDARSIVWGAAALAERMRSNELDGAELLYAAQLSAASHRSWALVGRESYAAKHWYLANELSALTASRKVPATIAILPALWGRIADGDERWGRRDRLVEAWSWLRTVVPELSADVRTGLPALFARWELDAIPAPSASTLRESANRCFASWGGVLPALGGLDRRSILQIFAESFPGTQAEALSEKREEVSTT